MAGTLLPTKSGGNFVATERPREDNCQPISLMLYFSTEVCKKVLVLDFILDFVYVV